MTNIDGISKAQKKRRVGFQLHAEKILGNYTADRLLSKLTAEIDKSKYIEWRNDYHSLITQGKNLENLSNDEARVFIMAVYGWMPVLYSQQKISTLKRNLKSLKSGAIPSQNIICESKKCFISDKHKSGSVSAFSKLLHFCSPSEFPIWDNRVAKVLGISGTRNDDLIYIDYLHIMSGLRKDNSLSGYYNTYKNVVDYKATKIRALEHGLFLQG